MPSGDLSRGSRRGREGGARVAVASSLLKPGAMKTLTVTGNVILIAATIVLLAGRGHAQAPASTVSGTSPAPADATKVFSLSGLAGAGLPFNGMTYGAGVGVEASMSLGNWALAAGLLVYRGDEIKIDYGDLTSFGVKGGQQKYDSLPVFVVVDGGYGFHIDPGRLRSTFTPFVSAGALGLDVSTSGVYGSNNQLKVEPCLGWGVSYRVEISARVSIGLQYRMYPSLGDTNVDFGDASKNQIPHGFSTSIFYNALATELGYRFGGS
jgi:hypothetical protein